MALFPVIKRGKGKISHAFLEKVTALPELSAMVWYKLYSPFTRSRL
jgi:hypothetical protein